MHPLFNIIFVFHFLWWTNENEEMKMRKVTEAYVIQYQWNKEEKIWKIYSGSYIIEFPLLMLICIIELKKKDITNSGFHTIEFSLPYAKKHIEVFLIIAIND